LNSSRLARTKPGASSLPTGCNRRPSQLIFRVAQRQWIVGARGEEEVLGGLSALAANLCPFSRVSGWLNDLYGDLHIVHRSRSPMSCDSFCRTFRTAWSLKILAGGGTDSSWRKNPTEKRI